MSRTIRAVLFQHECDARNMQRFRDALRDCLKQWFSLDYGSDIVAQLTQDLLSVVSLAEESPVNPSSQLFSDALQQKNPLYLYRFHF